MISYIILGVTFAFAGAIQPGPLQSFFISQSLSKGWRRTLPASFAPLITDAPIIILVVLILKQAPLWLINVLQIIGGLLLLYFAFGAWRNRNNSNSENISAIDSNQRTLPQAVLINFLNPAPYLGWSLIMGPLLIKGWHEAPVNGIALLAGFYFTMIVCSMGIIIFFASIRSFGNRSTRMLIGLSAIALGGFGVYQLWSGLLFFLMR